jgi:hypothetical protein
MGIYNIGTFRYMSVHNLGEIDQVEEAAVQLVFFRNFFITIYCPLVLITVVFTSAVHFHS